jgi:hypothetical protein
MPSRVSSKLERGNWEMSRYWLLLGTIGQELGRLSLLNNETIVKVASDFL